MTLEPLIRHHIARASSGVSYNAIENCHADGLHSIVLHDEPGNRVRMFYADWHHTLGRNRDDRLSIAIHPHHCAVRFCGLFGNAYNDVYALTPNPFGGFAEMRYTSAITNGEGSLVPTGRRADMHRIRAELLTTNPALRAHELHSIYLRHGARAAWLVIEGAENPDYDSLCWSNDPAPDISGLYQPMDSQRVRGLLTEVLRQTEKVTA